MPTSTQIQEGVKELLDCDVVVRMQSDAMQPTIPFGAVLYGKKVENQNLQKIRLDDEELYIVKTKSKQITVGRICTDGPDVKVFYDDGAPSEAFKIEQVGDVYLVSFIRPKRNMPAVWETRE